jgi:drug/metabolite transporter (DMT)-like permease
VALYKIDVTTMSPLFSLRTVFATLLGVTLLKESLSLLGAALIAIIILISPLAAYDEKLRHKSFLQKHVLLAVTAMASLALMGYFTNISVAKNGYASTLLWQDVLTLIMLLPTLKFVEKSELRISRRKLYPFALLGIEGFIYTVSATLAFAHNLTVSSVIVSLPLSMVFAYILSKKYSQFLEKQPGRVYVIRFTGAIVMVTCAIWLSFV